MCGTMDKGGYSVTIMQGNVTSVQKKFGGLRGPQSGEQSVRKPEQVPTSCENILQQSRQGEGSRGGCGRGVAMDNSAAE